MQNDMNNRIPSREELLLRVEASKERKRKRLAEMEVRARELFKERTGDEPKFVYSLWIHCSNSFTCMTTSIRDSEGVFNSATLIIPTIHPKYKEVLNEFTETSAILRDKPHDWQSSFSKILFSSRKPHGIAGFLFPLASSAFPKISPPHFPPRHKPSRPAAASRNVPAAVGSLLYVRPHHRPTSRSLWERGRLARGLCRIPSVSFKKSRVHPCTKTLLLCESAMTPPWLRFFHIPRYHHQRCHCLVEYNPMSLGKLGKMGKSKLGIFIYAHLLFQVNNK